MPTVLDLLEVPPAGAVAGVSLLPLMTGARRELALDAYSEAMYPLHHYGWSDLRALRSGRYKVIDAPRPELYDIDSDPRETTNLFPETHGAWRSHDRAAPGDGEGFHDDDGGAAGRRRRSGSARTARGARVCRLVRRHHIGCANRARRSEGQDRPLQQAGRGDRTVEGPAGRRRSGLPQGRRSPGGGGSGRSPGHRRLVHARHPAPPACRAAQGRRLFQEHAGAEAGLRPCRVQPCPGLPPAGG